MLQDRRPRLHHGRAGQGHGAPVRRGRRREAAVRRRADRSLPLREFLAWAFPDCDLVLVEGGRSSDLPKIEVMGEDPVGGEEILARVGPPDPDDSVPRFARDDVEGIARFIEAWLVR
jgi:molybdopterin-guanine dinucleotide biosynthesis protein